MIEVQFRPFIVAAFIFPKAMSRHTVDFLDFLRVILRLVPPRSFATFCPFIVILERSEESLKGQNSLEDDPFGVGETRSRSDRNVDTYHSLQTLTIDLKGIVV